MDETDRDTIRRNILALSEDLDFDGVSTFLYSKGIFEIHHIEQFKSKPSQKKSSKALLLAIQSKGPDAFKSLYESLVEAKQPHLAALLRSSSPALPLGSAHDAMPFENGGQPTSQPGLPSDNDDSPMDFSPSKTLAAVAPNDCNKMTSKPPRKALFINIEESKKLPLRQGLPSGNCDSPMDFSLSETVTAIAPSDVYLLVNCDSPMDFSPSKAVTAIAPRDDYKMSSKPRGIALIINNKEFKELTLRKGTDKDCNGLKDTFEHLGFYVHLKNNLKGKEIEGSIEQLSKLDHSQSDCVVLAILSHGKEGVILGTDSGEVEIHKMITLFNADNCQTLRGKPKLFFIQACRGDKNDAGVEASDGFGPAGDGWTEKDLIDLEKEAFMLLLQPEVDAADCLGSVKNKIPNQTDMLLGYSTIPGFVSWRDQDRGSWYIQALTEVFKQDAKKEDLVSMMTTVNAQMASKETSTRSKQASVYESSLRKKLFFFPGQ